MKPFLFCAAALLLSLPLHAQVFNTEAFGTAYCFARSRGMSHDRSVRAALEASFHNIPSSSELQELNILLMVDEVNRRCPQYRRGGGWR